MAAYRTRVAVVDQHELACAVMCRRLSPEEFDVVGCVYRLGEMSDLVEVARPDVLLLDVTIPGGDPLAELRAAKAASPTMRIAAVTASLGVDLLRRTLDAGADGFIYKGETAAAFVDSLRRIAAGRLVLSPGVLAVYGVMPVDAAPIAGREALGGSRRAGPDIAADRAGRLGLNMDLCVGKSWGSRI